MIVQLMAFALLFVILGIFFWIKKKQVLAVMFILLGIVAFILGMVTISLYPHTWPF